MRKAELIVAMDRPALREAGLVLNKLPRTLTWYKVGLELFTSEGPAALAWLGNAQKNIFLDLKLHDIPNTVARAVRAAAGQGVGMLTVHAAGGEAMLRSAVDAAKNNGQHAPKIIAVTVLTSLNQEDLNAAGIQRTVSGQALALAELALKSGADGLVASFHEAEMLRRRFGKEFTLVVPGIRPSGSNCADQKRFATPAMAIQAGADFLVVGRPVIDAHDPGAAALAILDEIHAAQCIN